MITLRLSLPQMSRYFYFIGATSFASDLSVIDPLDSSFSRLLLIWEKR